MKYTLRAEVTISLHATVEAETEAEALELADSLPLCTIFESGSDPTVEWCTSGELDGTPQNIEIDKD